MSQENARQKPKYDLIEDLLNVFSYEDFEEFQNFQYEREKEAVDAPENLNRPDAS